MKGFFSKNRKKILLISFFLLIYLIITIQSDDQKIYSTESLYDTLDFSENISKFKKRNFTVQFSKSNIKIIIGQSNNHPILLVGQIKNLPYFLQILNNFQRMECFGRSIMIKLYFKNIKIERDKYFTILEIEYKKDRDFLIYDVFNLTVPNSEILFLFNIHFPLYHYFSPNNILNPIIPLNIIKLNLSKNKRAYKKLCKIIRLIQNMESHSLGSYYYLPLNKKYITVEKLIIPCIIILFPYLENNNINNFTRKLIFCLLIIGKFFPFTYLFFILFNLNIQIIIMLILLAKSFNLFLIYFILLSLKYPWNFVRIYCRK